MFKRALHIFGLLFAGFAGGAMAPWLLGWISGVKVDSPADAVAIANTYIVFTTIIFVGVTVILAVTGYVFTQQFSQTKAAQESGVLEELKERIKTDEKLGIALANSILENSDVKRHLEDVMGRKLAELVNEMRSESQEYATQFAAEAEAFAKLGNQLQNGKGGK